MHDENMESSRALRELTAIRRAIHYLTLVLVLCTVVIIAAALRPDYLLGICALVGILILVVLVAGMLASSAARKE
jgi:hypothetical protein